MFEAREYLRKKLIGKKVNVSVDYIKPASDGYPEKTCATITIGQVWVFSGLSFYPVANESTNAYFIVLLYRPIRFQERGSRHTGGLPRAWQKMMQWPRRTPVPELKQDLVWNTRLLSCSWKPPRYGGRSDITFLKPNWSLLCMPWYSTGNFMLVPSYFLFISSRFPKNFI